MRLGGRAAGLAVLAVGCLVRAGVVADSWRRSGSALEFDDERLHWELACNLAERGELVSATGMRAIRMPAYPLFLAGFAWLGSGGVLAPKLAQALIGGATAWVAWRFARAAAGPRAGLTAGLLVAVDPFLVKAADLLLTETLFTALGLSLAGCAWSALRTGGAALSRSAWGVALLGPAAVMTRPSAAGWVVALWVALWLMDRERGRGVRRAALYVLVACAAMLPWGLRNRAQLGSFAWLGTNGGVTLYDAQGPQANGSSDQSFLTGLTEIKGLDEVQRDRRLRELAVAQMRSDPTRVARLAWIKAVRTWSPIPHVESYRGWAALLVSGGWMVVIMTAAAAGLIAGPGGPRLRLMLWLPIIYFTLVQCVYIGSVRYRVPLHPMLEIQAAALLGYAGRGAGRPDGLAAEAGAGT